MILSKGVSAMNCDFAELISILPEAWICWSEEEQEDDEAVAII